MVVGVGHPAVDVNAVRGYAEVYHRGPLEPQQRLICAQICTCKVRAMCVRCAVCSVHVQ